MEQQPSKEIIKLLTQKMKANKAKCVLHYLLLSMVVCLIYVFALFELKYTIAAASFLLAIATGLLPLFFFQDIISAPEGNSFDNFHKLPLMKIFINAVIVLVSCYVVFMLLPSDFMQPTQKEETDNQARSIYDVGTLVFATIFCSIAPLALLASCVNAVELIDREARTSEFRFCVFSLKWDVVTFGAAGFVLVSLLSGFPVVGAGVVAVVPAVAGGYAYIKGHRPKVEEKAESKIKASAALLA